MPARSAREDLDVFEAFPDCFGKSHIFQMDRIRVEREPSEHRVLDGNGLLIDLLEHEMLVAALLGHDRIPCNVLELGFASLACCIEKTNAVYCNDGNFMVIEKQNGACVRQ